MFTAVISERRAAALISAAVLGSVAAIELARVYRGMQMLIADELLGVAAALLFSITSTALVTNDEEETTPFVLLSAFALLAQGGTFAITLSPFGAFYLTLAGVLVALTQVMRGKATLGLGRVWKSARAAAPAVSPSPHATLA